MSTYFHSMGGLKVMIFFSGWPWATPHFPATGDEKDDQIALVGV